jgi:hypothetical protein
MPHGLLPHKVTQSSCGEYREIVRLFRTPESWICPPTHGPCPYNVVNNLFDHIRGRDSIFSQRERLGFNNVIMLARLYRAFFYGVMPTSWRPCDEELQSNGEFALSHARDLFKADNALQ